MRGVLPPEVIQLTPNVFTQPFWDAATEHRLVLPRCTACSAYRFPPAPFCWRCRAQAVEWVQHQGNGTIYSYTVVRHAVIPDVRDALPVVAAVVELPGTDGCRIVGNVVDCEPEDVKVDAPVMLDWYDVRAGTSVPIFRLI
jgi:uncharacterized OB-fold protein